MELSGEILTGHFFKGIPGIQFISHEAYRHIQHPLPENDVYWMNAMDPASLCGVKLPLLKGKLPSRITSNHLVYHGKKLVLISRRNAQALDFLVSPDNNGIIEYINCLRTLLTRQFQPLNVLKVERINRAPAIDSPYAEPLLRAGFRRDYRYLVLESL
jgi:ATP-dependent Lhr-like helicase